MPLDVLLVELPVIVTGTHWPADGICEDDAECQAKTAGIATVLVPPPEPGGDAATGEGLGKIASRSRSWCMETRDRLRQVLDAGQPAPAQGQLSISEVSSQSSLRRHLDVPRSLSGFG